MACDMLVRSMHEHIYTHTNTHPHTVADRWCMLKEIQAYPAQTAPVGLALQQRAIGVLMQELALFRPCNIHLKFGLHLEDTNILSFTVFPTSQLGKQQS